MATPSFQDWQQSMTFGGLSAAEQAKARSSQKYYQNFVNALNTSKYPNAVLAEHGFGGSSAASDPFAAMFAAMGGSEGPSYEQMQADADAKEAERLKTEGLNERDSLYQDYTGAAETATNYINTLVQQERSNAALMGVDYNLTDEMKQARTENYFAVIWSSANQDALQGLYDEWGYMEGMDESSAWVLQRGVGTAADEEAAADPVKVTPIKGQGTTLATQGLLAADEDTTQTSLLGG